MTRIFEDDNLIIDKDVYTNTYRISFFKNGHYQDEIIWQGETDYE